MELKIISPQENGFVEEIKWNNEELKAEIAAKMKAETGMYDAGRGRRSGGVRGSFCKA